MKKLLSLLAKKSLALLVSLSMVVTSSPYLLPVSHAETLTLGFLTPTGFVDPVDFTYTEVGNFQNSLRATAPFTGGISPGMYELTVNNAPASPSHKIAEKNGFTPTSQHSAQFTVVPGVDPTLVAEIISGLDIEVDNSPNLVTSFIITGTGPLSFFSFNANDTYKSNTIPTGTFTVDISSLPVDYEVTRPIRGDNYRVNSRTQIEFDYTAGAATDININVQAIINPPPISLPAIFGFVNPLEVRDPFSTPALATAVKDQIKAQAQKGIVEVPILLGGSLNANGTDILHQGYTPERPNFTDFMTLLSQAESELGLAPGTLKIRGYLRASTTDHDRDNNNPNGDLLDLHISSVRDNIKNLIDELTQNPSNVFGMDPTRMAEITIDFEDITASNYDTDDFREPTLDVVTVGGVQVARGSVGFIVDLIGKFPQYGQGRDFKISVFTLGVMQGNWFPGGTGPLASPLRESPYNYISESDLTVLYATGMDTLELGAYYIYPDASLTFVNQTTHGQLFNTYQEYLQYHINQTTTNGKDPNADLRIVIPVYEDPVFPPVPLTVSLPTLRALVDGGTLSSINGAVFDFGSMSAEEKNAIDNVETTLPTVPTATMSAVSNTIAENAGTTDVTVTLSTASVSQTIVTLDFSGTAQFSSAPPPPATDYNRTGLIGPSINQLVIPAGSTTASFTLTAVDNQVNEADKTIIIEMGTILGATESGTQEEIITIEDDEVTFDFSSAGSSGSESTTPAQVEISLDVPAPQQVSVEVNTADGTAVAPDNYTAITSQVVTFAQGEQTKLVDVTIVDDNVNNQNREFDLILSNPVNGELGTTTTHTYTIQDDDVEVSFGTAASNGAEKNTPVQIEVALSEPAIQNVSVEVTTADNTATAPDDYTALNGHIVNFAIGEDTKTFDVIIVDDNRDENAEDFELTLGNATNAEITGISTHRYTINDDDATVSFAGLTSSDTEDINPATISVVLSEPAPQQITVEVSTIDGTAVSTTPGNDFVALTNQLVTFNTGEDQKDVSVTILDDTLNESDEDFMLTLSNPTNAEIGAGDHTYTIKNNDPVPEVAFSFPTSSGDEGTGSHTVQVTLSSASGQDVTVDYAATDLDATGGGVDYLLNNGTITILAGTTTADIFVNVNTADVLDENDEQFEVTLSNPTGATLATTNTVHTFTIIDNDTEPDVDFELTASSDLENASPIINVDLAAASGRTVTVGFRAGAASTATEGPLEDYVFDTSTPLSFAPGETRKQITTLTINDDATAELDETVVVELINPTNATIGTNHPHTYTINDNDSGQLLVQFNGSSSSRPEASGTITIPVGLSIAAGQQVDVDFAVTGGSATSGVDFNVLSTSPLSIPAGQTTVDIQIELIDESTDENDETIELTLSNQSFGSLGSNVNYVFTIDNDDIAPTVAFTTASSDGDESVANPTTITVELSAVSGKVVEVPFTPDLNRTGPTVATAPADFTLAPGILTFNPGETSKDISPTIVDDLLLEQDETILIDLLQPTNATAGAIQQHTYTILDNETAPIISFVQTTGNANEDSAGTVTVEVSISGTVGQTATVDFDVRAAGGLGLATLGQDLDNVIPNSPQRITFTNGGPTTQRITFDIIPDNLYENDEDVEIALVNPVRARIGATAGTHIFTILNDDPLPEVQFTTATQQETEGNNQYNIEVSINQVSGLPVEVNFTELPGARAATAGTDYTLPTVTTISIPAGTTSQNIQLTINQDQVDEYDETVTLQLSGQTNSNLGTNTQFEFTIQDDDAQPEVEFTLTSNGGLENIVQAIATAQLSAPSEKDITVDFTLTGTATQGVGNDYTLVNPTTTLTFPRLVFLQTVELNIIDDSAPELDETVIITLTNPTDVTIGADDTHTYTIVDNDGGGGGQSSIQFAQNSSSSVEGDTPSTTVIAIPVSITNIPAGTNPTVDFTFINPNPAPGTPLATLGTDYVIRTTTTTANAGTLTFATGGPTTQNIEIEIIGDNAAESDEDITITLSNPTGGAVLGSQTLRTHVFTITDDDTTSVVEFSSAATAELEQNTNPTITLNVTPANQSQAVTVDYVVTPAIGSAIGPTDATPNGVDFDLTPMNGTITFQPGVNSFTFPVTITNDTLPEQNEDFVITLSNPGNAVLGPNRVHTYTILDDDLAGITVTPTVFTTQEGGQAVTYDINLNTNPTGPVVIDITSLDLTEGTVSPARITLTDTTPQTITITPVDDQDQDGEIWYDVTNVIDQVATVDPVYAALSPNDIQVRNDDNDGGPTTIRRRRNTHDPTLSFSFNGQVVNGISSPENTAIAVTLEARDIDQQLLVIDMPTNPTSGNSNEATLATSGAANPQSATFTWVPEASDRGANRFEFSVTDGSVRVTKGFTITVTAPGTPVGTGGSNPGVGGSSGSTPGTGGMGSSGGSGTDGSGDASDNEVIEDLDDDEDDNSMSGGPRNCRYSDINDEDLDIEYACLLGLISEASEDNNYEFRGDDIANRAEVNAMIQRTAYSSEESNEILLFAEIDTPYLLRIFNDVREGDWFYSSIVVNMLEGNVHGIGFNTTIRSQKRNFVPWGVAERSHVLKMMIETLAHKDGDIKKVHQRAHREVGGDQVPWHYGYFKAAEDVCKVGGQESCMTIPAGTDLSESLAKGMPRKEVVKLLVSFIRSTGIEAESHLSTLKEQLDQIETSQLNTALAI